MAQIAVSSSTILADSALYHRYLKGQSLYSETSPSTATSDETLVPSAYHWDLQETCKPMSAAFNYISTKLSQEGLSIHLIISDQHPSVIPVWQLPYKSQVTLCKIVRKACQKYNLAPSWMTALAALSKKDLPEVFETFKPDAYIIRRSMLQRELVYSSEGLTLLSIDHIFTLKQLLRTFSKREWVSSSRESCLESCVHLLHRIHRVYTGKPASAAYIERVYKEIPFQGAELEEVIVEYNARYCTATICEVDFQPKFSPVYHDDGSANLIFKTTCQLSDSTDPPRVKSMDDHSAELFSQTTYQLPDPTSSPRAKSLDSSGDLVSPLEVDLDMVRIWEALPLEADAGDDGIPSPSSIHYPSIPQPSSTPPSRPPITTASQLPFPPPQFPPPTYPLPPPPPMSRSSISSRNTISTYSTESDHYDLPPPPPLKITKRSSSQPTAFPSPPGYRGATLPLLASSVFTDTGSAVDGGGFVGGQCA